MFRFLYEVNKCENLFFAKRFNFELKLENRCLCDARWSRNQSSGEFPVYENPASIKLSRLKSLPGHAN